MKKVATWLGITLFVGGIVAMFVGGNFLMLYDDEPWMRAVLSDGYFATVGGGLIIFFYQIDKFV